MSSVEVPANALIILVGPAGCGKSTFARSRFRETEIVSSDRCRALVSDDEADQSVTPQAYAVFHTVIRARLSLGRLTVADATNLSPRSRESLRRDAERYAAPVVALVLDVPLEVCLEQARGRARQVREEVIRSHYEQFLEAVRAIPEEGYHAVHRVTPETGVVVGPAVQPAQAGVQREDSSPAPPAAGTGGVGGQLSGA